MILVFCCRWFFIFLYLWTILNNSYKKKKKRNQSPSTSTKYCHPCLVGRLRRDISCHAPLSISWSHTSGVWALDHWCKRTGQIKSRFTVTIIAPLNYTFLHKNCEKRTLKKKSFQTALFHQRWFRGDIKDIESFIFTKKKNPQKLLKREKQSSLCVVKIRFGSCL